MELRMNSEQSTFVKFQLFGLDMRLAQDPNSQHLGKTVWDASMVLAKYLERNENKGEFSRKKLAGKRALELGAGCGLAGMGLCLLGCHVVTTDQRDVLPLLQQNIDWNVSSAVLSAADSSLRGPVGDVLVAELDWGNDAHVKAVNPPFDLVVAADVLYAEHLVEPLLRTIAAVTGPRTTTLISYELRSHSVHTAFLEQSSRLFSVRKIPHAKMHPLFQHPSIDIYALRKLPQAHSRSSTSSPSPTPSLQSDGAAESGSSDRTAQIAVASVDDDNECKDTSTTPQIESGKPSVSNNVRQPNEGSVDCSLVETESDAPERFDTCRDKEEPGAVWASRRAGVEAARLLAGIKLDSSDDH
ncbi:hypothetical protein KFL_000880010 [Klebsormidium nitens]|uniref:Uncharacterized protein n=1 Tax=Klebsormidium nitens TaxID=105231 RepID=A0A1Y1HYS1_KLENI|nr:hypothetical protein KFL_000880010 [Klebsormidium nitens]|eukprot:GAQ81687.1 hypothetical protein KFL_000880010 [Klebsormidium nitens]